MNKQRSQKESKENIYSILSSKATDHVDAIGNVSYHAGTTFA